MSYKVYSVMRNIGERIGAKEWMLELESSSEKEVEEKLSELAVQYGSWRIKVFKEVEFSVKALSQLKGEE